MNMPGFSAELSLSSVAKSFGGRWRNPVAANAVEAAVHCDQACLNDCLFDLSDCDDLPVRQRAQCRAFVIRHNLGCRRLCCH
jgi:hypothetical protein